ncbi:MAG: Cof-type HAD-IIB family hydrolase [Eggerthellaceae bacterium]|nr:Cof-type HAD-IIB family hydrolase [Eggerthellaceae bacterium]
MEKATYTMLALDLDGTLTNAAKEITPRVKQAIRKATEKGVSIVLASGRPIPGMAHVANELELDKIGGYVLSNNGSKIVDWKSKEVVFEKTLPRDAVEESCFAAHHFGVTALVYDEKELYSEDPKASDVEQGRYNNSAVANKVNNLESTITWDPNKMMVVGEPDKLISTLDYLQNKLAGVASVFLSEPYFIEIAPEGIKKDAALGVLAKHLNTTLDHVMACGDGYNDIPMLECAGLAVAMDNAYPETKEYADWIAPSNEEDGVAVAIEKFILYTEDACY